MDFIYLYCMVSRVLQLGSVLMSDQIKDYVFYVISKEIDWAHLKGISYGVERNPYCKDHDRYFEAFKDIDDFHLLENIHCGNDWVRSVQALAEDGNIMIVNTAVEIEKVEDRLYGIYLPSFPTMYQIQDLKKNLEEFRQIPIDIDVYGKDREHFLKCRSEEDYNALNYLIGYIAFHEKRLNSLVNYPSDKEKLKQKVV